MNRQLVVTSAIVLSTLLAACGGGTGSLGTLPPGSSTPEPSLPGASPDATPGTGSPSPSRPASQPSDAPPTEPAGSPPPEGSTIVRAYFHLGGDESSEGIVAVLREVPKTQAVARAALEQLLLGLQGRETFDGAGLSTMIPEGTQLLGISIDDGVATVDLSGEFATGGGSASAMMRLAQVTFTLTQFPTVQGVSFKLDGRPVTVFGSEGIVLDGPVTREDYTDLLSDIWVDRPAWGAGLGNPARITGLANVFEAHFRVAILDGDGLPIADEGVMATCGTGCYGTFDVTLHYDVSEPQYGALRVYNLSAMDGSPEAIRDYPVWLTPQD